MFQKIMTLTLNTHSPIGLLRPFKLSLVLYVIYLSRRIAGRVEIVIKDPFVINGQGEIYLLVDPSLKSFIIIMSCR